MSNFYKSFDGRRKLAIAPKKLNDLTENESSKLNDYYLDSTVSESPRSHTPVMDDAIEYISNLLEEDPNSVDSSNIQNLLNTQFGIDVDAEEAEQFLAKVWNSLNIKYDQEWEDYRNQHSLDMITNYYNDLTKPESKEYSGPSLYEGLSSSKVSASIPYSKESLRHFTKVGSSNLYKSKYAQIMWQVKAIPDENGEERFYLVRLEPDEVKQSSTKE